MEAGLCVRLVANGVTFKLVPDEDEDNLLFVVVDLMPFIVTISLADEAVEELSSSPSSDDDDDVTLSLSLCCLFRSDEKSCVCVVGFLLLRKITILNSIRYP